MSSSRIYLTGGVVAALAVICIVPWSTSISIPSIMTAEKEQSIYAPFPAVISELALEEGRVVKAGDLLVRLEAPQLERDADLAMEKQALLESRIDRTGADAEDRASLVVLTNELAEAREQIAGQERTRAQLEIRAPFDGVITDVDPELHAGMWINEKSAFALVRSTDAVKIKGYVNERDVFRFEPGAEARFIPDAPELSSVDSLVVDVAQASSQTLDEPYLALPMGGSIAVEEASKEELRPIEATYAVALLPSVDAAMPQKAVRGVTVISGKPQSFYTRIKKQVLKVLVREMGV